MDNNAQGSSVGEMTQQKVSVQPEPVAQPQPVAPPVQEPAAEPVDDLSVPIPPPPLPQPAAPTMPPGVSPRPEMGPVAVTNPVAVDADTDEQPVARQEAPVIQQAHPEVVMPKEVASAGVTPGPDADKKQLPEEKQQLETVSGEAAPVATPVAGDDSGLPMTYEQALEEKKKHTSIKDGVSWIAREVLRQWQKRFEKTED